MYYAKNKKRQTFPIDGKKRLCKKMRKEGRGILSLAEYGPEICLNPWADTL